MVRRLSAAAQEDRGGEKPWGTMALSPTTTLRLSRSAKAAPVAPVSPETGIPISTDGYVPPA
jgi:hypothetical protein